MPGVYGVYVMVATSNLTDEIAAVAPYANTDENGEYVGEVDL